MANGDHVGDLRSWARSSDSIWFGEAEDPESKQIWPAKIFDCEGKLRFIFLIPGGKLRAMPRKGREHEKIRLESVRPAPEECIVRRLQREWSLWRGL